MLSVYRVFLMMFFVFIVASSTAQSSCNPNMKCQMNVEQIIDSQQFDKDSYESEKVKIITDELFLRFDLFYIAVDGNTSEAIKRNINAIDVALNSATILGMDFSMFDDDIKSLENYR
jgi:hypothetical protein